MFQHFDFVTLVIKLWKCKPWRMSDKSAHKILIYGLILKSYSSTESLKCAQSYIGWIDSPSNDTKSWFIDITINDSSFNYSGKFMYIPWIDTCFDDTVELFWAMILDVAFWWCDSPLLCIHSHSLRSSHKRSDNLKIKSVLY